MIKKRARKKCSKKRWKIIAPKNRMFVERKKLCEEKENHTYAERATQNQFKSVEFER